MVITCLSMSALPPISRHHSDDWRAETEVSGTLLPSRDSVVGVLTWRPLTPRVIACLYADERRVRQLVKQSKERII